MDMSSSHDGALALMNAHEWYRIVTPMDWVRAILWCLANFLTAIAYFFIPNEIRAWRRVLPRGASATIGTLFIGFIAFCGLSHFAMLFIMQTGPWWATLFIYVPMALVSVATVVVLRMNRKMIVSILASISAALASQP